MSKTRDTGYLANVIQVHDTGVRIMSGSTMLMAVSSSGAVTITGEISGSDAANALLLSGTGSLGFTTTSSFLAVSSSQQQVSASYIALSASYNTFSGSASTRITVDSASLLQVSSSQQQISASLLQVSASYISLSGSYNTFSGSASTRITVDSASLLQVSSSQQQISSSLLNVISVFATTGSNSFRANQSITGSLVVSSTITAQTLVVQTVTSSIVYSSGSNIFGCDLNSRQTFTGSVLITGSLTIAGASSATSYSGATIFGSTIACSPIGCFATSCATAFIGGTMSGTTIYGSTAVCSPVGKFSTCLDLGGALSGTSATFSGKIRWGTGTYEGGVSGIYNTSDDGTVLVTKTGVSKDFLLSNGVGATVMTIPTGTTNVTFQGAATFSSTISGTTIYGSTAVCSPVGKFSTCLDLGGALSGTSATFSGNGAFSGVLQVAPTTQTGIIGVGDNFGGGMNAGIYRGGLGVTTAGNYLNIGGYDGVVITTGAAALGSQTTRLTIASTGAATFNGCATFSCTAQFSKIQKHPTGYWYKIPFSVSKNTNVGTASTFCMVNITSQDAFNEMFIYVEYASRLQGQSDTQTQVSSRMYGINRFSSGTIAVTNSYTLVGGAGCVIDTHAPITAVAVGTCTIVVKVDFSTCTSYSSFVWGEIRVYSIENLNSSLTIPYNEW